MSIAKTDGYQDLLDYWNGNALQPSVEVATVSLMELAEGLKTENCVIQTNVPDAMFRQVATDETKPSSGSHIRCPVWCTQRIWTWAAKATPTTMSRWPRSM